MIGSPLVILCCNFSCKTEKRHIKRRRLKTPCLSNEWKSSQSWQRIVRTQPHKYKVQTWLACISLYFCILIFTSADLKWNITTEGVNLTLELWWEVSLYPGSCSWNLWLSLAPELWHTKHREVNHTQNEHTHEQLPVSSF